MTAPTERWDVSTVAGPRRASSVRLGDSVIIGGPRVPIFAPPGMGADVVYVSSLRETAPWETGTAPEPGAAPLLVELSDLTHYARVSDRADAIVVPDTTAVDRELVIELAIDAAARHLPVILRVPSGRPFADTVALVDSVLGEKDIGNHLIIIACAETTELADLRRRVGIPVIADIGDRPELAAAAVAAGADGVWLSATAAAVSQAKEAVIRLTPLVRQVIPQTLTGCRDAIDGVDAVLATLLEYRVSLAGQVQRLKSVGGHAGRDPQREAAIVRGMAARASSLLPHHVERIVDVIIAAGLDVSERELLDGPPVWRM